MVALPTLRPAAKANESASSKSANTRSDLPTATTYSTSCISWVTAFLLSVASQSCEGVDEPLGILDGREVLALRVLGERRPVDVRVEQLMALDSHALSERPS